MLTAILISADRKFAGQVQMWVHQGLGEKLRTEIYPSVEAYNQMLEALKSDEPAPQPPPDANDPGKKVRVFILDVDLLGSKPIQAVTELQKITKATAPVWVDIGVPKVMLMAFENGTTRLDSLQHDAVDDLILKPVDKTLFQQKMEFLIADSPKVAPSFLFRAKTQQIVEVGRDVMIDEISEYAAAIRSPGPVPEGAFAAIHSEAFGGKGARRIIGRVYESGKHPIREGEYLVRFAYFGISTDQLSTVRRYIRNNQTQVRANKAWATANSGTAAVKTAVGASGAVQPPNQKANPGRDLAEKMALLKMRKLAVIDMNLETLNEAKSILDTGFKGVSVKIFPSFARLAFELMKMLPSEGAAPSAAPVTQTPAPAPAPTNAKPGKPGPNDQAFPTGKRLSIVVRGKSHELVRFEPDLKKTDLVLGKQAVEWLARPDLWLNLIQGDDKESFDEFMTFVEGGSSGRCSLKLRDDLGKTTYIEAIGRLEKAGDGGGSQLIRIELNEFEQAEWEKAFAANYGISTTPNRDPSNYKFEAILIDGSMLRPTPAEWYEQFIELLRKTKVIEKDEAPPKILVMSDPRARARTDDFRIKGISTFTYKPLDRRYMLQLVKALCPQLILTREPDTADYVPCEISAKLGKEVVMDEVSEYGLTIQHPSAFRDKSHMRFFSRLFGEEGEWVAGRCHTCEKTNDHYRCHFMYFGPGEELLQRIRRWIREDHVAKKEKS